MKPWKFLYIATITPFETIFSTFTDYFVFKLLSKENTKFPGLNKGK